MAKYINPYADFGCEKFFGEQAQRNLLADETEMQLPSFGSFCAIVALSLVSLFCCLALKLTIFFLLS
jgi:hypothetical protein